MPAFWICIKLKTGCSQVATRSVYSGNVLSGGSNRANYCTVKFNGMPERSVYKYTQSVGKWKILRRSDETSQNKNRGKKNKQFLCVRVTKPVCVVKSVDFFP